MGATENALMAAVLAKGHDHRQRPASSRSATLLNRMGGRVIGAGTSTITVEGVEELQAVEHTVVPDWEAATYLAALGVAGGEITLEGARPEHMTMLVQKLGEMGMRCSPDSQGLWALRAGRLRSVDVATLPYPGLATDYKPFLVAPWPSPTGWAS